MKYYATLVLIGVLFSCNDQKFQSNIDKDEAKEQLTFLKETQWPKAYREQDTTLLNQILGDDFQMIDASGAWTNKQDELQWIKKNSTNYDSFYYEIRRLDLLDNGTAIICGTGHIYNDTTKTIYQSSNVLEWRNDEWKAVLSHVSGIKTLE